MASENIVVYIDNKKCVGKPLITVLELAQQNEIFIPRLCYVKGLNRASACRVCLVEIEGQKTLKTSCNTIITNNMVVHTKTPKVLKARKKVLELLAGNHRFDCWNCSREHNCEFYNLLKSNYVKNPYGEKSYFQHKKQIINQSDAIKFDSSKCVLCGRCVQACRLYSSTNTIDFQKRGVNTYIGTSNNEKISSAGCIYCGKCIQHCPTGAIVETDNIQDVLQVIADPKKIVICQTAPSVRVGLAEEFGHEIGTNCEKKMYAALKKIGFNEIGDTNLGADFTITEEATEFVKRLIVAKKFKISKNTAPFIKNIYNKHKNTKLYNNMPLFTSCSPGWMRYVSTYFPKYLKNTTTAKSPHQMFGAIVKHYWAKRNNCNINDVVVVSIMPCIAKKYEINEKGMQYDGVKDVDYVITTRELARIIRVKGIDFNKLKPYTPSSDLAIFSGGGAIFGVTGGVMESSIRTAKELIEGKKLEKVDFTQLRGYDDIKEATIQIGDNVLNIAIVSGGSGIKRFLTEILPQNKNKYHYVEFMGCRGGCINGGGQPIVSPHNFSLSEVIQKRGDALYIHDAKQKIRCAHWNPSLLKIYEDFFDGFGGKEAHKYLHCSHSKIDFYKPN